jgi:hypothetical protein
VGVRPHRDRRPATVSGASRRRNPRHQRTSRGSQRRSKVHRGPRGLGSTTSIRNRARHPPRVTRHPLRAAPDRLLSVRRQRTSLGAADGGAGIRQNPKGVEKRGCATDTRLRTLSRSEAVESAIWTHNSSTPRPLPTYFLNELAAMITVDHDWLVGDDLRPSSPEPFLPSHLQRLLGVGGKRRWGCAGEYEKVDSVVVCIAKDMTQLWAPGSGYRESLVDRFARKRNRKACSRRNKRPRLRLSQCADDDQHGQLHRCPVIPSALCPSNTEITCEGRGLETGADLVRFISLLDGHSREHAQLPATDATRPHMWTPRDRSRSQHSELQHFRRR